MQIFEWGVDPWGQEMLVRISWDLLYLAFWTGIAFILFHIVYAAVWLPKLVRAKHSANTDATVSANLPPRITRHTAAARFFHWIMAASMILVYHEMVMTLPEVSPAMASRMFLLFARKIQMKERKSMPAESAA